MKPFVIFALAFCITAFAQTTLPNLGKTTPARGTKPWSDIMDDILSGIDSGMAFKPPASAGIQWALSTGNDANDGLTAGKAKLTLWAALQALPGGSASPATAGKGVVFIGPNVPVGAPDGGGLRLVGGGSDFTSPPIGWMRSQGTLAFRCINPNAAISNTHEAQCSEQWGSTNAFAAVQINATAQPILFERFAWSYQGTAIRLGVNSVGNRTEGAQGIHFIGCSGSGGGSAKGWGPQVDIGSNVFWVYIDDGSFYGSREGWKVNLVRLANVVTATVVSGGVGGTTHDLVNGTAHISVYNAPSDTSFQGTYGPITVLDNKHFTWAQNGPDATVSGATALGDKAFGIVVDPGGAAGSGDIEVTRTVGTGIKFYDGNAGGSILVRSYTVEGSGIIGDPPGIWFHLTSGLGGGYVDHMEIADTTGVAPAVVVDTVPGIGPSLVTANFLFASGCTYDGPMTLGGSIYGAACPNSGFAANPDPFRTGARGIVNGVLYAQSDDLRSSFAPVMVRYPNIIPSTSNSWTVTNFGGGAPSCSNVISPDGTLDAYDCTGGGSQNFIQYQGNGVPISTAVGDYYIFGVRSKSGRAGASPSMQFFFNSTGNLATTQISTYNSKLGNDGQWVWSWGIAKVTKVTTNPANVALQTNLDTGFHTTVYPAIMIHIPTGEVSDNEAFQIALHLVPYNSQCVVGTLCGMTGTISLTPFN